MADGQTMRPNVGPDGCTCGLGPEIHSTGCAAYRRRRSDVELLADAEEQQIELERAENADG